MIQIWIKERGGSGEEMLYRKLGEADGIKMSYEVVPYLADIDHKKYSVSVVDKDGNDEWDYTWELCPHCNEEVLIAPFGLSYCSSCGELIAPCSMCDTDYNDCENCPYEK